MPPDLQYLLGEMNSKLDTLINRAEEDRKTNKDDLAKMEARLEKLEAWRWGIMGAASALGAAAGFLATMLGK